MKKLLVSLAVFCLLDQTRETSFESEEFQEYWIESVRSNLRFFVIGVKWKL